MILGLAMSDDDLVGIIVVCILFAYLVYALVFPEKL